MTTQIGLGRKIVGVAIGLVMMASFLVARPANAACAGTLCATEIILRAIDWMPPFPGEHFFEGKVTGVEVVNNAPRVVDGWFDGVMLFTPVDPGVTQAFEPSDGTVLLGTGTITINTGVSTYEANITMPVIAGVGAAVIQGPGVVGAGIAAQTQFVAEVTATQINGINLLR